MFDDLVVRAKNKSENHKIVQNRKSEVHHLLRDFIEQMLSEMQELGFYKVLFHKTESTDYFELRIATRKGYDYRDFTYNLELNTMNATINYGYGANFVRSPHFIQYDYNWNNSKIISVMKHALRDLIGEALNELEICKINGWA